MSSSKRMTISFEPGLHKALKLKAAQTKKSISDLVNVAVRRSLAEAEDLEAFKTRKKEPNLLFEDVFTDLKAMRQTVSRKSSRRR